MAREHKRLREAVEDYLRFRQAKFAPTTVANEAYVLRRFAHQVGDIQLRHLRPEAVAEWFYGPAGLMSQHQSRRRPPVRASTHNFYRTDQHERRHPVVDHQSGVEPAAIRL